MNKNYQGFILEAALVFVVIAISAGAGFFIWNIINQDDSSDDGTTVTSKDYYDDTELNSNSPSNSANDSAVTDSGGSSSNSNDNPVSNDPSANSNSNDLPVGNSDRPIATITVGASGGFSQEEKTYTDQKYGFSFKYPGWSYASYVDQNIYGISGRRIDISTTDEKFDLTLLINDTIGSGDLLLRRTLTYSIGIKSDGSLNYDKIDDKTLSDEVISQYHKPATDATHFLMYNSNNPKYELKKDGNVYNFYVSGDNIADIEDAKTFFEGILDSFKFES